ncbi:hypothetical protein SprV_0501861500 [Sparganum proliferum]
MQWSKHWQRLLNTGDEVTSFTSQMNDLLSPLLCVISRPKKTPIISTPTLPHLSQECSDCLTSILSDFDECEVLAKGDENNKRWLNRMQLKQIRSTGTFYIDSQNFPGFVHCWRISPLLQLGKNNNLRSLKTTLTGLLELICIGSRDRIIGDFFSLKVAATAAVDFLQMTFDLFIGWPQVHRRDVDKRLLQERLNFLTQDLSVKTLHRYPLEQFWNFFERLSTLPNDYSLHENMRVPQPPYMFITPSKVPIDLRLHNVALLEKCLVIINQLRQIAHGGWFDALRTNIFNSLKDSGKSTWEIKKLIRTQGLHEYASRLFEAIRQSEALKKISPTISETLVQQAQFNLATIEARAELADSWISYKEATEKQLQVQHPILWNLPRWRNEKIKSAKVKFMTEHKLDVHKSVLAKCTNLGLHQFTYFVKRDLVFLTEREQRLREELSKTTLVPDNRFAYVVPCKLIRYWKVFRRDPHRPERLERIKTVLSKRPSLTGMGELDDQEGAFRAARNAYSLPLSHPTSKDSKINMQRTSQSAQSLCQSLEAKPLQFSLVKHLSLKTSTRYVFWRWMTNFAFTCVLLVKICQFFLYIVPFKSAFSLCALFQRKPIYLDAALDNKTGCLYYTDKFYKHTLCSRLLCIWRSTTAKVRSFSRPTSSYYWNRNRLMRSVVCIIIYVFRALLPSLLLLIFLPPLCLLISFASISLGLILPLLIPFICAVVDLFGVVVWDAYKPASYPSRLFPIFQAFFWHLGLRCILQFILALFTGLILNPLLAVTVALYSLTRWAFRSVWDALIFHVCLRHCLRVPAKNSWVFKQLQGPGLSDNHFYKTNVLDICIVLASQLEQLELTEWQKQMTLIAQEPLLAYTSFAENLAWLSLCPVDSGIYAQLKTQTAQWMDDINKKYQTRKNGLDIRLTPFQASRTKMSAHDLQNAMAIGASFAQRFYRARILPRLHLLGRTPEDWWACRGLHEDDFPGLCMQLLKLTFGDQLLTSLQETDTAFPLHVRNPVLTSRFLELLSLRAQNSGGICGSKVLPSAINIELTEPAPKQPAIGEQNASQVPRTLTSKVSSAESVQGVVGSSSTDHLSHQTSLDLDCDGKEEERDDSGGDWHACSLTRRETVITVRPRAGLKDSQERVANGLSTPLLEGGHSEDHLETPVYIHIDLPLFPLSVFVPPELRRIYQGDHRLQHDEENTSNNENELPAIRKIKAIENSLPKPVFGSTMAPTEGLATILRTENETALNAMSTLAPSWTPAQVSAMDPVRCRFKRHHCHHSLSSWVMTFWKRTFSRDWRVRCTEREDRRAIMAFMRVINNVGEIPHAAHIALLMHSRMREENAVQMSRPLIRRILHQLTVFPHSLLKSPSREDNNEAGEPNQLEVHFPSNLSSNPAEASRSACTMPFLRGGTQSLNYRLRTLCDKSPVGEMTNAPMRGTSRDRYDEPSAVAMSHHPSQKRVLDGTSVPTGENWAWDLHRTGPGTDSAAAGKWENFGIANWWESEAKSDFFATALYSFATVTDTNTSVYETEDNMTTEDLEESESLAGGSGVTNNYRNGSNVDQPVMEGRNFEFLQIHGIEPLGSANSEATATVERPTLLPVTLGTSDGGKITPDYSILSNRPGTDPHLATPVSDAPPAVHPLDADRPACERCSNLCTETICLDWPVRLQNSSRDSTEDMMWLLASPPVLSWIFWRMPWQPSQLFSSAFCFDLDNCDRSADVAGSNERFGRALCSNTLQT